MLPNEKLESLRSRYLELEDLLCQQHVLSNAKQYTTINRERAELEPVVEAYARYCELQQRLEEDREHINDPELRPMVLAEIPELEAGLAELERQLSVLLLPRDPNDARNTVLEIRSGTGGEEAALFAADLCRR